MDARTESASQQILGAFEVHCRGCGRPIKMLPNLYFQTEMHCFGCEACNTVIEYNFRSVMLNPLGVNPCKHTYKEYLAAIEAKKKKG